MSGGHRRRATARAVLVPVVAWAVMGCAVDHPVAAPGQTPSTGAVQGTITVAAAASLTEPFTAIGAAYERAHPGTQVVLTFASSATLENQIENGSPADVFASADESNMTKLERANLLAGPARTFAHNKLAIVVKRDNPRGVHSLSDLPGVGTVSLCGPDVPCGMYADTVLQRAGVVLSPEHVTRGENARATLTAVADGDADAGVVYVTDISGDKVTTVAIPDAENAVVTYPIAVVRTSTNPGLARSFTEFVLGREGQALLEHAGFSGP